MGVKPPLIIFVSVIAMAIALVIAAGIGESPVGVTTVTLDDGSTAQTRTLLGHGVVHPDNATMQIGADGEARHDRLFWVAWFFGLCQIVIFIAMLALGMRKESGLGPVRAPLLAGGAVFVTIFTLLFLSYRAYMRGDETDIVMGFPTPTAWMVYGVWLFPLFFAWLYLRAFDAWHLTDADRARFDALLAKAKRSAHGGPEGN